MSGGLIGKAVSRLDGPDKVSGRARYTADTFVADATHAVIVTARCAKGTITRFNLTDALAAPGVIRIFTHLNTPRLVSIKDYPLASQHLLPLQDDRVMHDGQPVALVVADTLEHATEAARRVEVLYREIPFNVGFLPGIDRAEVAPAFFDVPPNKSFGDVAAAWTEADATVDGVYTTSDRHHSPIELSVTLAIWNDGHLLVHDATQGVVDTRNVLARALGLAPANVRVRNENLGGGFGCKHYGWPHQILAAMAARELGRPVKLVLTRAQSFTGHGHQPATRQRVRLSARADGALTGIRHDTIAAASRAGDHVEGAGWETAPLYACPSVMTTHSIVRLDRSAPWSMRSPFGGVGLVSVEIAMDELAFTLGMDPLALRLKNHADLNPVDGRAFSSKKLRECYEVGARRFGWADRSPAPRSMRAGRDLVGYGMATAILPAYRYPAKVRVSIDRTGQVLIEASTQELGTGTRTVFPQIAADVLGIPVERVTIELGDTALPTSPVSGASATTMSVGAAVMDGALKLKALLAQAGASEPADFPRALARLGASQRLSADGEWTPGETAGAIFSFGAIFAEVRIDEDLPIPRVSRIVAVYSAGKIVNPKTAHSQMTGGIIWGLGQALLERSETDLRLGRFLSKNLAGYLVPVNADVPDIDASFVEEFDTQSCPFGGRGIGELGAIGVGAAVANAVFHATGHRVRDLPIRPEHLMEFSTTGTETSRAASARAGHG
ncbi:xanthine dehydrogenase molybdenum binding subunit apoprotein [Variovorax sp. 54]|uniref:xanthine dehydrogenase family protein molybdopterin-binding subunit n=1 Tax=Variovorax sp. 54 TaxID=2035212 RepID=UPI000C180189|nr:xanthine dehydrogenase family protein molybdopterin-binding subunit [Variovorax sp. 54]PIF73507.1 xanthine dehydrogenase molybdenum binding subunit apoprotein [Variovorax sp. 54]